MDIKLVTTRFCIPYSTTPRQALTTVVMWYINAVMSDNRPPQRDIHSLNIFKAEPDECLDQENEG